MIEQFVIEHTIQKHILGVLLHREYARFRDLRPSNVDTNLYSYHLKKLLKRNYVLKTSKGYTLGLPGMVYVDRINTSTIKVTPQPKIITMSVIFNKNGDVIMYEKLRQPFIYRWTLPLGKLHNNDSSLERAAQREVYEKTGVAHVALRHVGECYIRVVHDENVELTTLAHVFVGTYDGVINNQEVKWVHSNVLADLNTAPAIRQIIQRVQSETKTHFFDEINEVL